MDIKKIVFFILTFLGTTIGQLFVRIVHLDGSLDQWWFLIPPLSLPPLSIIPAYYIYKGRVKKGTSGLPYDVYSVFPILLTIIINLLIERYFELTGASGAVIKYIFNVLTFSAVFYLRDANKCGTEPLNKSRDYVCKRMTCDKCPKISCPIVTCPKTVCPTQNKARSNIARPVAKPFPFGNVSKSRGRSRGRRKSKSRSRGGGRRKRRIESFETKKINNILSKYDNEIKLSNSTQNNSFSSKSTTRQASNSYKEAEKAGKNNSSLSNRIYMLLNKKEHFSESMSQRAYTNIMSTEQNPLGKKPMEPVKGTPFIEKIVFEAAILSLIMPLIPYVFRWIPYLGDTIVSLGGISPYLGTVVEILVRFLIMKLLFIFINMYNGINIVKSCKVNYKIYYPVIVIVIGLVINILIESNKVPLIPLEM